MKKKYFAFLLSILVFITCIPSFGNFTARAVRIDSSVVLDGKLNEDFWKEIPAVTGYVQKDPEFGKPSDEKTELFFAYDRKYLYIGAKMHKNDIDDIRAFVSRRDNQGNSERIIVSLDTYGNNTTACSFAVTATGVRADYYHPGDEEHDRDYDWNPVWEAEASINPEQSNWTAEMKIPFSQLRFNNEYHQVWGLNSNRYIPSSHQDLYLIPIPKNESGWASRFGELRGIEGVESSTGRIELLPYVLGGIDIYSQGNTDNPFFEKNDLQGNIGTDFKMGFGPNMTLDATVNPDFGQVEADPAVVNLTEFETYYDEKRPFFIEGNSLFTEAGANYFYSRRIGARPSYVPSECSYSKIPRNTSIPAAAKLTGRTETGMSYGVLSAITSAEYAECSREDGSITTEQVEPLTLYNVVRFKQEFGDQGSGFGVIATSTNRRLAGESALEEFLPGNAYTGGLDWDWFFADKKYNFNGYLAGSSVNGSREAIRNLQESTTHNFGRPDAEHLSIDSTAEALSGTSFHLELQNEKAEHWFWEISTYMESPGFDLNALGRLMHADEFYYRGELKYKEITPGDLFYRYEFKLASRRTHNTNFDLLAAPVELTNELEFLNRHNLTMQVNYSPRGLNDTKSRGGPMTGSPESISFYAGYNSDYAGKNSWGASINARTDETGGNLYSADARLTLNYNRLKLTFSTDYTVLRDKMQYVAAVPEINNRTFGTGYIFGDLDRQTLSGTVRLNYSFSPDLTFELYTRPYASAGRYLGLGMLGNPGDYKSEMFGETPGSTAEKNSDGSWDISSGDSDFTIPDHDFRYISLRTSAVLRWEFRPGSTFFLVWQMNKHEDETVAGRINPAVFEEVFGAPGINSIAAKLSWWIPLSK